MLAVAVALRVAPWLWPHTFLGVQESDDGVYYGASRLLLHGLLPYDDFTIVHPPGVSVLLLPFAALGEVAGDAVGLAAARVAIVVIAVANVLLVHRLALLLPGPPERLRRVALVAAGLYALMPDAVVAEHTVLLEPVVTLFGLLALVALLRRPGLLAAGLSGASCIVAVSVKLFACLYVVGLLGYLLGRTRRHLLVPFVAGLTVGSAVLVLPFFLVAPSAFWHDVVVTQLSRPADAADSGVARLVDMTGLGAVGVVAGAVLLVVVLAVVAVTQGRPSPPYALVGLLGVAGAVAFLRSPSYFPHYGAFLAPFLALVVSRCLVRDDLRVWLRRSAAVVVGCVAATYAAGSAYDVATSRGQDDFGQVGRLVGPGSCVFSELASPALAAGVLRDPSAACPSWLDGRGVAYTQATGWPADQDYYPAGFVADARWQEGVRAQLAAADYLLISAAPGRVPEWDQATRAYAAAHFSRVLTLDGPRHAHAQLWRRTPP